MTYHCNPLHFICLDWSNDKGGLVGGHRVNQARRPLTHEDVIETSLIAAYIIISDNRMFFIFDVG